MTTTYTESGMRPGLSGLVVLLLIVAMIVVHLAVEHGVMILDLIARSLSIMGGAR